MTSSMTTASAAPIVPDKSTSPGDRVSITSSFPRSIVDLSFINFVLKIITLGIYTFWARTEERKRIWASVRLNEEPLTYTGTGKELFLGFLIVFGLLILPTTLMVTGLLLYIGNPKSTIVVAVQFGLYGVFLYLYGVAIYSSQRYILARTTWRGIRGRLDGSAWSYGWTSFWTLLLLPLSLGWAVPWRSTKLRKIMTNDTRFGSQSLQFTGNARPLYRPFAIFWITMFLLICVAMLITGASTAIVNVNINPRLETEASKNMKIVLGFAIIFTLLLAYLLYKILSAWYRARAFNYFASATKLDNARFKGTATGPGLVWLAVSNFLITIFSLGILSPVVLCRRTLYFVNNLGLDGNVNLNAIAQASKQDIKYGEGLAQALDIDVF